MIQSLGQFRGCVNVGGVFRGAGSLIIGPRYSL